MSPRIVRFLLPLSLGLNVAFFALIGVLIFSPHQILSFGIRKAGREEIRERMMRSKMESVGREIELSDQQWAAIRPLMDQAFESTRASSSAIRTAESELLLHVLNNPLDEEGFEERFDRLHGEFEQTGRRFMTAAREASTHLTPEQIQELNRRIRNRDASGAP